MPRKRQTKAGSRAKPKAPEGSEGEGLTVEERRDKLHLFLKDFDNEVQNRIDRMRKQAKQLCDSVSTCYRMELMKLPKRIRDMKRSDFMKLGGNVSDIEMKTTDEIVDSLANSIDQKVAKSSEKSSRTVKKTVMSCDTIAEEEECDQDDAPVPTTVKKSRTTRGKKTSALVDSTNMPPPSTQRTRRTQTRELRTPAVKGGPSRAGWETPLVTPKFDPRLPVTPGMLRNPKPGERVMSMAGSPLAVQGTGDGSRQILLDAAAEVENMEIPTLDSGAIENIQKLHEKLGALLQQVK